MPKYLILDHGGVLDGEITLEAPQANDLLIAQIDEGTFQVLKDGVKIVKALNELVNNWEYQLAFHSKNTERSQLELLRKLQQACALKGLTFPKVVAMAARDPSLYSGVSPNHPQIHNHNGMLIAGYDLEEDGKACVRKALMRALNIAPGDINNHIIIDDGAPVIAAATKEGWQGFRVGDLSLSQIIHQIYSSAINTKEYIVCCLSMQVMQDPVVAVDGFIYERSFITDWLSRSNTSPISQQELANNHLISHPGLKNYLHNNPNINYQIEFEIQRWHKIKSEISCFKNLLELPPQLKALIQPMPWEYLSDLNKAAALQARHIDSYQFLTAGFQNFIAESSKYQRDLMGQISTATLWLQNLDLHQNWITNYQSGKVPNFLKIKPIVMTGKSWHFDATPTLEHNEQFKIFPGGYGDYQKVLECYNRSPIPGSQIAKVEVIYNHSMDRIFDTNLNLLQAKQMQAAFTPSWQHEPGSMEQQNWRQLIHAKWLQTAEPHVDSDFPAVKLIPAWHGTRPEALQSIASTGYSNLRSTDDGYIGAGIYSTPEPKYAQQYSRGMLLMNWISMFSAFPVIDGDMPKLRGKGNYKNYDGHFAPVKFKNNDYFPCTPQELPDFHEIVVFQQAQCLPRYIVYLSSGGPTVMPNPEQQVPTQSCFMALNELSTEKQAQLPANWDKLSDIFKLNYLHTHRIASFDLLKLEFKQKISQATQQRRHEIIHEGAHMSVRNFWESHESFRISAIDNQLNATSACRLRM